MEKLTRNGKILVIIIMFFMLFGGYTMGLDQFSYHDTNSALTVLAIYGLLGIFTAIFLFGKPFGLKLIMGLQIIFFAMQLIFTLATLFKIYDAGPHDPMNNYGYAMLMYMFSVLIIIFSIKVYMENRSTLKNNRI